MKTAKRHKRGSAVFYKSSIMKSLVVYFFLEIAIPLREITETIAAITPKSKV